MSEEVKGRQFLVDLSAGGDPFSSVVVNPKQEIEQENNNPPPVGGEGEVDTPVDGEQIPIKEEEIPTTPPPGGDVAEEMEEEGSPPISEERPQGEENTDGEDGEVNPYFYLGQQLREDGFLDMEIGNDVDGLSIYNAYREKLKKDAEPQVRQEIVSALQAEGFDSQDLLYARAIRQGVDLPLTSRRCTRDIPVFLKMWMSL